MDEKYVSWIIQYLQGQLGKNELKDFLNWVNTDAENKKLFFDIKTLYETNTYPTEYDARKSWEQLSRKHNKVIYRQRLKTGLQIFSYAAMIIAIISLSVYIWHNRNVEEESVTRYISIAYPNILDLPDGSKVHIGPQTNFYYKGDYGKKQREVYLEGEAYFDVAKQKDKPFIVVLPGQKIEVVGTKFNVLAYPEDSLFVTTLTEGAVKLFVESRKDTSTLKPNEQFIYNRQCQNSRIVKVNAEKYAQWIEGYYYFLEEPLEIILNRLERVYGYEFYIESNELKQIKFTGTFYKDQNINEVLEIIQTSVSFRYRIEKRTVTLYK
ncbi:FecR family protein [Parabacteroides pacaensis]|uniref:FecR family protein n=1 Tax=Parabacteroides pacaensis TaxID=2086575 RepID=UPI000D0F6389|nr:FecR family protein [Parabacteroides pacaensis]